MAADRPARRRSSLADEHPAYVAAAPSVAEAAPRDAPSATSPALGDAPMPPPRRRRAVRVQLNTRIQQDIHERLQTFVENHDAAVQDVVETALTEYFERRS